MSRRQTAGLTCGGPTSRYFQVLPLQQVDLTALCRHMSGHIPTAPTEEKEGFLEAELPLSVTEIPSEVLTNLPG